MAKAPAGRIVLEERPVAALIPYARNTKLHPAQQVAEIAASIKAYGFNDPVGVDGATGEIIEGHGRVLAAKSLGIESVPCNVLHGMTPAQIKAYRLVHNRIQERSGHDKDLLALELKELATLQDPSLALDLVGFDADEIGRALKSRLKLPDIGPVGPTNTAEGGEPRGEASEPAAGEPPERGQTSPPADERTRGSTINEQRFPLAVMLTKAEYDQWAKIKEVGEWKNDAVAFRAVLESLVAEMLSEGSE
jgi:ParB-like nuclease domain